MDEPSIAVRIAGVGIQVGASWLLDDVCFECRRGEWTLIEGQSGSGKSTLLRAVNGLRLPTRGCIWTLGSCIPGRTRREARTVWRQTGTVLQEVALFETRTARQNVELALRSVGRDRRSAHAGATEWLERMGLGDKLDEYPCNLSGGQCQRVALSRALAGRPRLLLADEPTSALDREAAGVFFDAVRQLVEDGACVVMSSHRIDETADRCDQRILLRSGRVESIERRAVAPVPTPARETAGSESV
jgi:ABC-type methionine transport system ATPase subunit